MHPNEIRWEERVSEAALVIEIGSLLRCDLFNFYILLLKLKELV